MTCTLPRQGLYAPNSPPPPPPPQHPWFHTIITYRYKCQDLYSGVRTLDSSPVIPVQKALSGTVSCNNRAYARDTSRGLRVLCTSPVSHARSSPCQIIPHPLAQSASAPGSCKIFYDSLFSTLRLAALIEWETEIRQAGEAVLFYLENDENNALRFSHGFAVDFETLK